MIFLLATIASNAEQLATIAITVVVGALIYGLPLILIIRLIKYLGTAGKEQQRIRMEMSKIADEVQKVRQELQGVSSKLQPPKQ
jgi:uncharacterized membrane-anchored protein YhcB (DUF1043 family)